MRMKSQDPNASFRSQAAFPPSCVLQHPPPHTPLPQHAHTLPRQQQEVRKGAEGSTGGRGEQPGE